MTKSEFVKILTAVIKKTVRPIIKEEMEKAVGKLILEGTAHVQSPTKPKSSLIEQLNGDAAKEKKKLREAYQKTIFSKNSSLNSMLKKTAIDLKPNELANFGEGNGASGISILDTPEIIPEGLAKALSKNYKNMFSKKNNKPFRP